jgi:hypothetical protein
LLVGLGKQIDALKGQQTSFWANPS